MPFSNDLGQFERVRKFQASDREHLFIFSQRNVLFVFWKTFICGAILQTVTGLKQVSRIESVENFGIRPVGNQSSVQTDAIQDSTRACLICESKILSYNHDILVVISNLKSSS